MYQSALAYLNSVALIHLSTISKHWLRLETAASGGLNLWHQTFTWALSMLWCKYETIRLQRILGNFRGLEANSALPKETLFPTRYKGPSYESVTLFCCFQRCLELLCLTYLITLSRKRQILSWSTAGQITTGKEAFFSWGLPIASFKGVEKSYL